MPQRECAAHDLKPPSTVQPTLNSAANMQAAHLKGGYCTEAWSTAISLSPLDSLPAMSLRIHSASSSLSSSFSSSDEPPSSSAPQGTVARELAGCAVLSRQAAATGETRLVCDVPCCLAGYARKPASLPVGPSTKAGQMSMLWQQRRGEARVQEKARSTSAARPTSLPAWMRPRLVHPGAHCKDSS